jgi:hypothetical protein
MPGIYFLNKSPDKYRSTGTALTMRIALQKSRQQLRTIIGSGKFEYECALFNCEQRLIDSFTPSQTAGCHRF